MEMKKVFNYLLLASVFVIFIAFSSCAKEDPAEAVDINAVFSHKAKISGTAYVNINQGGSELVKFVPAGTNLVLTATNASLLGNSAAGNYVVSTTVGENGHYEAVFPTRTDGTTITVTINVSEFTLDNIFSDPTTYATNRFSASPVTVDILRDSEYVRDLKFNATPLVDSQQEDGWEMGTYVYSDIQYANDDNDPSKRTNPENFKVKITISKNNFVPALQSDLILNGEVISGKLTINTKAPTVDVNSSGLPFTVEGSTILEVKNTDNKYDKYIFTFNQSGAIYGGEKAKIEKTKTQMVRGTKISSGE